MGKEKRIFLLCLSFLLISTAVLLIWLRKFIEAEQLIAAHCPFFLFCNILYYHRVVVKTLVNTTHCSVVLMFFYVTKNVT